MSSIIYFDNAATTLCKPRAVPKAVRHSINHYATPGRGGHAPAIEAARAAYLCRSEAAKLFKVKDPGSIALTFNATHGLNLAIKTLVGPGTKVVISGYEHNAVTRPLHALKADVRVARGKLFDQGAVLDAYIREIRAGAEVVILNHVSNVFGFIQPAYEISALCGRYGVPLILDASQSAGTIDIDASRLKCAFIAMPGHKGLYGPQGTGILICGMKPRPLLEGGTGSESRNQNMPEYTPDVAEAGTHNIPGISGLLEGLRYVNKITPAEILTHERWLIRRIGHELSAGNNFRVFLSPDSNAQSGVLSVMHRSFDSETAAEMMGEKGFALRAGLHCAPLAHESAGTIDAGTLRISASYFNTTYEANRLVRALSQL